MSFLTPFNSFVYGSELNTDGMAGFIAYAGSCNLSLINGKLQSVANGANPLQYKSFNLLSSKTYQVAVRQQIAYASKNTFLYVGSTIGSASLLFNNIGSSDAGNFLGQIQPNSDGLYYFSISGSSLVVLNDMAIFTRLSIREIIGY